MTRHYLLIAGSGIVAVLVLLAFSTIVTLLGRRT